MPSATKTQLEFVPEYSEPVESLFKALDVVFEPLGKMAALRVVMEEEVVQPSEFGIAHIDELAGLGPLVFGCEQVKKPKLQSNDKLVQIAVAGP